MGKVPSNYTKRLEQVLYSLCLKSSVANGVIQSASSSVTLTHWFALCSCNVRKAQAKMHSSFTL